MVSCRDIQERVARGETPTAEERAHLDECEACQLLLADDNHLGDALAQVAPEGLDLAGVREAVGADVAAETGLLAYLRSRTTPMRVVGALGIALVVALAVVMLTPRPDLNLYPRARMVLAVVLLVVLILVGLVMVLRPLHHRPLPRWLVWGALAAAVAVPWVLALLPRAHELHPAALRGEGPELLAFAVRCLAFGIVTGLPLLIALWAFDRGAHASLRRAFVAAGVAGVMGNLALQAHCPITAPAHLALGHATVGLVLLGAYVLAAVRGRFL